MKTPRRRDVPRGKKAILSLTGSLVILFLSSTSCATARRGTPVAPPVEPTTKAAEEGRLTFSRSCYTCHGNGEGGLAPALNDKPLPSFLIRLQVRRGLGAMPAFDESEIPDRELDNLIAYIGELRQSEKP